ncbi:MAG: adenylyltransferase/cytidyltransferase family protein [Proteobacteria bacterium]|nr:adenylyltransferase/cytidyltransferase family protein [Pseudomonadota bacterium]
MKIIVVSGGFDPIHSGHLLYLNEAAALGDKLVVLLNSDTWLKRKKGTEFMNFNERKTILLNIKCVDEVYDFEDDELGSCINGLEKVKQIYSKNQIIFCNGGDRTNKNIPELIVEGIDFIFGVGGNFKKNSSSTILSNWKYPSETRVWGFFSELFQDNACKVKRLVVNPMSGMSFQRHFKRNEIWLITEGKCDVIFSDNDPGDRKKITLNLYDYFFVPIGGWHQITNPYEEACKIIELQYGEQMIEEDIERIDYYDNPK